MSQLIAIALGGALGALGRFGLSSAVFAVTGRGFPWGTLAVNVVGSFIIGLAAIFFMSRSGLPFARDALIVGFLGSLTTFSTFSLETVQLLQDGSVIRALLNVLFSVLVCIGACALGILCARSVGLG